jgi:hypothetical protein
MKLFIVLIAFVCSCVFANAQMISTPELLKLASLPLKEVKAVLKNKKFKPVHESTGYGMRVVAYRNLSGEGASFGARVITVTENIADSTLVGDFNYGFSDKNEVKEHMKWLGKKGFRLTDSSENSNKMLSLVVRLYEKDGVTVQINEVTQPGKGTSYQMIIANKR